MVSWMDQAIEVKDVAGALLPEGIQALCEDLGCHGIVDSLPKIVTRGLVPPPPPPCQGVGNPKGTAARCNRPRKGGK
jgi:hypothetical protein